MRVLLVKPRPEAVQFGLAPFFQTEPLGLEYVAAALEAAGHTIAIADLRFDRRPLARILRQTRPALVGISCLHILDVPAAQRLAEQVKGFDRGLFVAVGGHAASAYPEALRGCNSLDAVCIGEGEQLLPELCRALEARLPLRDLPSLLLPAGDGDFAPTTPGDGWLNLARVAPPARAAVAGYQQRYCCLNYMPVWTIETGRGCPHRCKFCSVWQFYRRSHRFHSPAHVRRDFESAGHNVFLVDDIFWAERDQSEELARTLAASPERKNWMLAQSRADLVSESGALLELWRPLARNFDIFFGFESPTSEGLEALNKGSDPAKTVEAIRVARRLGFGVTGNFIVDPDFSEDDFRRLWEFLDANQLYRVGFTILTPLPGTYFFEQVRPRLEVLDWNHYDLHHLLWQPRLGVERFFELYCETWRRSVLNTAGRKSWWRWLGEIELRRLPRLVRVLARTQKLMDPKAYLAETGLARRTK